MYLGPMELCSPEGEAPKCCVWLTEFECRRRPLESSLISTFHREYNVDDLSNTFSYFVFKFLIARLFLNEMY